MRYVLVAVQVVVALGLLNVWILRAGKPTDWRGGASSSMKEEFEVYGLPGWFMGLIGILKVGIALALLAGIWFPLVVRPAAAVLAVLMLGAIVMHFKVADPPKKSLPAAIMLLLSLVLALA